jgi:hypothetical protein
MLLFEADLDRTRTPEASSHAFAHTGFAGRGLCGQASVVRNGGCGEVLA